MAVEYDPIADHYTALGLDATATHDDIKKAHRTLIRQLHPDRGGEAMPAAQVNIARDVLMDPVTRHEYDQARIAWHDANPFASLFTEAGQQLHRERQEHERAISEAAQRAWRKVAAREAARKEAQTKWHSHIAKSFVIDKLALAIVAGDWLDAVEIVRTAYLLDQVIENRVGSDPEKRASAEALAKSIQLQHAKEFVQALSAEIERYQARSGAAAGKVVRKKVRRPGPAAQPPR